MKIAHIVGARPNFMKAAPVFRALAGYEGISQIIIHTGQHYDFNMSDVFFKELELPAPDINLGIGSGTHAQQTSQIISHLEPVLVEQKPDLVVVYGDVNSTVAAALVCAKLIVPVAHVEAGLRSFDRTMPEEVNRVLTDQISDLLFTPSEDGNENLKREGIAAGKIHLVGNVMIDTLIRMLPKAQKAPGQDLPGRYALVTLHRPSNVDDLSWLTALLQVLAEVGRDLPVVFPVHPRTRKRIGDADIRWVENHNNLQFLPPVSYLDFLGMQSRAAVVITDSGGIQEETTYLGVPCLTVRDNTERPITTTIGTNTVVGRDVNRLRAELACILAGRQKIGRIPPLWDGHAAQRIAGIVAAR